MKHVVCTFILKLRATDYVPKAHLRTTCSFCKRVYIFFWINIDLVFFEAAGETKGSAGFGIKLL